MPQTQERTPLLTATDWGQILALNWDRRLREILETVQEAGGQPIDLFAIRPSCAYARVRNGHDRPTIARINLPGNYEDKTIINNFLRTNHLPFLLGSPNPNGGNHRAATLPVQMFRRLAA